MLVHAGSIAALSAALILLRLIRLPDTLTSAHKFRMVTSTSPMQGQPALQAWLWAWGPEEIAIWQSGNLVTRIKYKKPTDLRVPTFFVPDSFSPADSFAWHGTFNWSSSWDSFFKAGVDSFNSCTAPESRHSTKGLEGSSSQYLITSVKPKQKSFSLQQVLYLNSQPHNSTSPKNSCENLLPQ